MISRKFLLLFQFLLLLNKPYSILISIFSKNSYCLKKNLRFPLPRKKTFENCFKSSNPVYFFLNSATLKKVRYPKFVVYPTLLLVVNKQRFFKKKNYSPQSNFHMMTFVSLVDGSSRQPFDFCFDFLPLGDLLRGSGLTNKSVAFSATEVVHRASLATILYCGSYTV